MRRAVTKIVILLPILLLLINTPAGAAGTLGLYGGDEESLDMSGTNVGFSVGGGLPVGWWSDRWGMFQTAELNLRYEFSRGQGLLLFVNLAKADLADLSKSTIIEESQFADQPPEVKPYYTFTDVKQGGTFRQLPLGIGYYREFPYNNLMFYGSAAFAVHLWKLHRTQTLQATGERGGVPLTPYSDDWEDSQDGAETGWRIAGGLTYPIKENLALDCNLAWHITSLSNDNGALAYWGFPVRGNTIRAEERKAKAEKNANFILLQVGVRYGL